jgi:hypothetical protein
MNPAEADLTRTRQTKTTMNEDPLPNMGIIELLTRGPIGARRRWAATLVLRMLEQRAGLGYRTGHRLAGEDQARAALEVLRQALAALGPAEQQLMLRVVLLSPWEDVRRRTGLTLRVPKILTALVEEVGTSECVAAARSAIGQGPDAVRRYPVAGLLPEVRLPGEELVIVLDAEAQRLLHTSQSRLSIDRLTAAVQGFRTLGWEANLRPLVSWWIGQLHGKEPDDQVAMLLSDLPNAAANDQTRWRSLGLLDWLACHPAHPRAGDALAVALKVARADVRKAAAALGQAMGCWEELEALAQEDPDKGVRARARKLLPHSGGSGSPDGQRDRFG